MKLADELAVAPSRRNYRGDVIHEVSPALSAHRGWQVGIHDAYKWLLHRYPTAAKALRENYGMSPNGTITISLGTETKEGAGNE